MTKDKAVIGMQWGDEGKGKIIDVLAPNYDIVVRFGGGANAGHTVIVGLEKFVQHLLPCGIIPGKKCVVGNGVLVNFDRLDEEIEDFAKAALKITEEQLRISEKSHIVTPYSLLLDLAEEIHKGRKGGKVGTTMQGIGPTVEAQASRIGYLRADDLVDDTLAELEKRLKDIFEEVDCKIIAMDISPMDMINAMNKDENSIKMTQKFRDTYFDGVSYIKQKTVLENMLKHKEKFTPFITGTDRELQKLHEQGKAILYEGAQGTMLDIHHGSYPKLTSTTATMGGIHTGTGTYIPCEERLGVLKAYTTRVGEGAFPTELAEPDPEKPGKTRPTEVGARLQERGGEFGATTGRVRRTGWLDLVIAAHAVRTNGINEIAITKLDILDTEEKLEVCVAYELDGQRIDYVPSSDRRLARAKPIYQTLPGWKADTTKAKTFEELPENARNYIGFIENFLKVRIKYVSNGAERSQIITR